MAAQKPSIPKGTRDFNPTEMVRRNYIFQKIRENFRRYGFLPIETPALENLSTLMGKYGDEGDKLLFRVLNSGNFLKSARAEDLQDRNIPALAGQLCDRGLRYDLTVPFARFVVQHRNDITFPFKRYQIQPVWRADRPQKGRYREFYQCDADVVGSNGLFNEVELISIIDDVFSDLGINVVIKINNRKVLAGIAEVLEAGDKLTALTVAIDKLEKTGIDNVVGELKDKGFGEDQISRLIPLFEFSGDREGKLCFLDKFLSGSETGKKGIAEIREIMEFLDLGQLNNELEIDLALARGLNYYTGAIIEVKAKDVQIGSICGGGRYDNLTGIFGLPGVSGVGISFGADRIYDVLEKLDAFPQSMMERIQLMFANFGSQEVKYIMPLLKVLRKAGINTEIYPDPVKMKKQFSYANAHNIPYVAIVGEEEIEKNSVTVKDMKTGSQQIVRKEELIQHFS